MTTGLLGFTSIEERGGDVRQYISPSRLNCRLGCGLEFRCRYIDGLPSPTTPALFLGRMVHRGFEVFYRHRQLGITLPADEVVQRLLAGWAAAVDEEEMAFDSAEQEQAMHRQAADLIVAYLKYAPADEKPLAVEAPLVDPDTGEDLGLPLVGVMDLVLDEPEGAIIADFKTAAKSSPPDAITREIRLSAATGVATLRDMTHNLFSERAFTFHGRLGSRASRRGSNVLREAFRVRPPSVCLAAPRRFPQNRNASAAWPR